MAQKTPILRRASAAIAAFLGAAAIAQAAALPQTIRLESIFSAQSFDGLGTGTARFAPSAFAPVPLPIAVPVQQPAAAAQEPPVIPDTLWAGLAPLNQNEAALLFQNLPQANPADARRLDLADADLMIAQAVSRKYNVLELFTNPSWTQNKIYFVDGPDVAALMAKYGIDSMVPAEGKAQDGKPYHMLALVIGQGRLAMLMDRSNFRYKYMEDHGRDSNTIIVTSNIVRWTIHAPGDLMVSGLKCAHFLVNPTIEEIAQISPSQARVQTDWGDKTISISPIVLNNDKKNGKTSGKKASAQTPPSPAQYIPILILPPDFN